MNTLVVLSTVTQVFFLGWWLQSAFDSGWNDYNRVGTALAVGILVFNTACFMTM